MTVQMKSVSQKMEVQKSLTFHKFRVLSLILLMNLTLQVLATCKGKLESRSFRIDYKNDVFLKDGKPFRYVSGTIAYYRIHRMYWMDRLMKMKFVGLNAIDVYVPWNVHEAEEGQFNFEEENDLVDFIKMADSVGLLVILRPGPYICGEWDFGGFPAWLLKNPAILLRSSKDKRYIDAVDKYMGVLLPKIQPLLYHNGGPIISVQVENEYGSYFTCDHDYMSHLENLFRQHLGNETILFTTDGANKKMLECGSLPSLFTTVDFGPGVDPAIPFKILREFQPNGPLVNSEFYTGWLDHWGENHQKVNAAHVGKYLDMILAMNASVNMYMFEGGTSFGYMNGANCGSNASQFQPQPTSYDYDAPLSEAGDATQKYFVILEIIARYMGTPSGMLPPSTPKYAYGRVNMTKMSRLLDVLSIISPAAPVKALLPITMEQLGQNYGFAMYQTQIPSKFMHSTVSISIPGVRDRAVVYVGEVRQATISRTGNPTGVLTVGAFRSLAILVENMGHVNYGNLLTDPKGIIGNVTINNDVLVNWTMYPLNLTNVLGYTKYHFKGLSSDFDTPNAPTFFTGNIPPASDGVPKDTFLNVKNWHKGQVFINGFNVGRYWPTVGPQDTLYVPASILYSGQQSSKLVLLELDQNPCDYPETCFVTFDDTPTLDGPVKPLANHRSKIAKPSDSWISKYMMDNSSWDAKKAVNALLKKAIGGFHRRVL